MVLFLRGLLYAHGMRRGARFQCIDLVSRALFGKMGRSGVAMSPLELLPGRQQFLGECTISHKRISMKLLLCATPKTAS
jgi:hypothetical protein